MSIIRANEEPEWEDVGKGMYVYSDGKRIIHLPRNHENFIEIAMRMLDQEGSLDDETLEEVHETFRERLWLEDE